MNNIENINPLYHNPYGVAFQWKRCPVKQALRVQLVFRDTGLSLSYPELGQFSEIITKTLQHSESCADCTHKGDCRVVLLNSPIDQLSFAMSHNELKSLEELVAGTIFQLGLNKILDDI